jgi:hypothetical protein
LGGAAWQVTNYDQTVSSISKQDLATALIVGNAQFFKFSKTTFNATASLYPALNQPGRLRSDANVAYYIKIWGNLKWNISFYGNWDNEPPARLPGSDYGLNSGVSWSYGLK